MCVVYFDQGTGAPHLFAGPNHVFDAKTTFTVNKCLKIAIKNMSKNCVIFAFSFLFSFFFLLVMKKDEKTCFNAKTNDFDQPTVCKAPVCW